MGQITEILKGWSANQDGSLDELAPLIHEELHKIAAAQMRGAAPDHMLQATALMNEAYLRLLRREDASFESRGHFYALAAKIMRGVLVDFAREHEAQKRGSGVQEQIGARDFAQEQQFAHFLDVHQALDRLEAHDARKAALVELKFFGGLTFEEIAEMQGVSVVTAKRDWAFASSWLRRELGSSS